MSEGARPQAHIVAAFGAAGVAGTPLPGLSGRAWRFGDIVLLPAKDPVAAAWIAGVFESLRVTEFRVARPVRSLDGRWVVGGWRAERFMSGRPAPRYDDMLSASLHMDTALAGVAAPRFLMDRADWYGWADRLSWDRQTKDDGRLGQGDGAAAWFELAAGRSEVRARRQVIHADMFGNVLFAGSAPPAVVDFTPLVRPAGYAAALVVVDAVAWGGAPASLAAAPRAEVPDWGQLLRRAILFRLAMVLSHPRSTPAAVADLLTAARQLRGSLDKAPAGSRSPRAYPAPAEARRR